MVSDNQWQQHRPGHLILRIISSHLTNRSFVVSRSQTVWKAKTWGTNLVWFLVLAFMLTLQMAHSNKLWWKVFNIYNHSQWSLNPPKSRISVANWRTESAECLWSWWCWWQKRAPSSPSNCGVQLNWNEGREAFIHAEAIRQIQRNLCQVSVLQPCW